MRTPSKWLSLAAVLAASCGDETALHVAVDLTAFSVPAEVDRLFLELLDEDEPLIAREYLLEERRPVYRLIPGPRFPTAFDIVAHAYLGEIWVAQSEQRPVRFTEGEIGDVVLLVERR
jgi:hypothetical protein